MFKCVGRYGDWLKYKIDLGESETIEGLLSVVIQRMNSLKPIERVYFFVFENDKKIGRFMRADMDGYGLEYVPNEEIDKFVENKKKRFGLLKLEV